MFLQVVGILRDIIKKKKNHLLFIHKNKKLLNHDLVVLKVAHQVLKYLDYSVQVPTPCKSPLLRDRYIRSKNFRPENRCPQHDHSSKNLLEQMVSVQLKVVLAPNQPQSLPWYDRLQPRPLPDCPLFLDNLLVQLLLLLGHLHQTHYHPLPVLRYLQSIKQNQTE